MPLGKIADSITNGIGSQLGELSMVFGFGAMLGRLVSDSGGAYMIASTLIKRFGKQRLQIAVMIASFILGIALFFEVGMVLLVPIVFAIAVEAGVPILYLGIPMAAALSVTHGFLPPHPAPQLLSPKYWVLTMVVFFYSVLLLLLLPLILPDHFSQNWHANLHPMPLTEREIFHQSVKLRNSVRRSHHHLAYQY